jgi:hypothetical protein
MVRRGKAHFFAKQKKAENCHRRKYRGKQISVPLETIFLECQLFPFLFKNTREKKKKKI